MFTSFFKAVYEGIRDRIKNPFSERATTPFVGAFLIALLVYNWQILFTLFSFDPGNSRKDKIDIITNYFLDNHWIERLLFPLLITFVIIVLYYLFSNLSLGISTFFNRWFKATILYLTDRSKIIPRDEHEKTVDRLDRLRQRYEVLKKSTEESQSELDDYKKQIELKDQELLKINSESAERKEQLDELMQEQNAFKILYASYGKEEKFNDVTDIVRGLLKDEKLFQVENHILGGDPYENKEKEIFIIFQVSQEIKTITASEHNFIELYDNDLKTIVPHRPSISSNSKNIELLTRQFKGDWQLLYEKGNKKMSEKVKIDNTGKYYANDKHRFNLKDIIFTDKKISFQKELPDGKLYSIEHLEILNNNLIQGSDSLGYSLKYKKL